MPGRLVLGTVAAVSQILEHLDDVGPGWSNILFDLHRNLVKVSPDYDIGQIKEKFGGLRVYLDNGWGEEVEALIDAATARAAETCEVCGLPGKLRDNRSWLKTLCDDDAVAKPGFMTGDLPR